MINLSKLEEVEDLREVWKDEARDFTPWLAEDDNITQLSDAIGIDIEVEERESSVGSFNADIYAYEVDTDRKVIIENQLGDTNHDHLGKLITYASGKSAETIVWIVKHARDEHKSAIEWLNNHTDPNIGFFLCEIKLYKIGNSDPAVKFDVVEKPNDWNKEFKKSESVVSETEQERFEYWAEFEDYAFQNQKFAPMFRRKKPSYGQSMTFSMGSSACNIGIVQFRKKQELGVEIYIYDDQELFNTYLDERTSIENETELTFDWQPLPKKKASRVIITRSVNFDDRKSWEEQFDWAIDKMTRMKPVFRKYL